MGVGDGLVELFEEGLAEGDEGVGFFLGGEGEGEGGNLFKHIKNLNSSVDMS